MFTPKISTSSPAIGTSLFQLNLVSTSAKFSLKVHRWKGSGSFRISGKEIPARDRIIDIGKYKGKMLGSLPSSYLKWVSKNLRAGRTEEWARLADEVLADPVYRDRIEWEMAEKILNGNTASSSSSKVGSDAVSELLEISGRFRWDNEDKQGWSKIDFGLLGTSRGGSIPRLVAGAEEAAENADLGSSLKVENVTGEESRRRRREMNRVRRQSLQTEGGGGLSSLQRKSADKLGEVGGGMKDEPPRVVEQRRSSPFPGRQVLLDKLQHHHRGSST